MWLCWDPGIVSEPLWLQSSCQQARVQSLGFEAKDYLNPNTFLGLLIMISFYKSSEANG